MKNYVDYAAAVHTTVLAIASFKFQCIISFTSKNVEVAGNASRMKVFGYIDYVCFLTFLFFGDTL